MLAGIKDETLEEIQTENNTEEEAVETFTGVKKSKKVEISTLLNQFERKMKRIGELKVEVVNLERQLAEQSGSLEDDKQSLDKAWNFCDIEPQIRATVGQKPFGRHVSQDARGSPEELRKEGRGLGKAPGCAFLGENRIHIAGRSIARKFPHRKCTT